MEEKNTGELTGGVKVGPVDSGATIAGVQDEGLEGRVEGGQQREIGWVFRVLVSGMDHGSLRLPPPPLLARHFSEFTDLRYIGLGIWDPCRGRATCPDVGLCERYQLLTSKLEDVYNLTENTDPIL